MLRRVARRSQSTAALVISSLVLTVFAPTVGAANGLEVTTPFPAVAVAPGNKVSFDLTIDSTRNADVALSLTAVPSGWTASLIGGGYVVDGVAVAPGKPGEVRLDVNVPADATGSSTIRVTARGGGAEDVLPITVRVNAEAAGALSLTTNTPELTGASDKSFKFDLSFKNDTAQDVTVSPTATGPTDWDIETTLTGATDAASTVVKAGATQSISVTAKAPEGTAADTYPIHVTATAGDRTVEADLTIAVTGSYGMDLAAANNGPLSTRGSAGSATTQTFEITNTGTAPITAVKLEGTPPGGWTVTVDPADGLQSIEPNQTGRISATITPSGDAVAGDYMIDFKATSAENTTGASADFRFTVETSPIWAFVGIALIALILGGLYYVFRTYGRR